MANRKDGGAAERKEWPNCKCTFAQHMVGDGCHECNPEFADAMLAEREKAGSHE